LTPVFLVELSEFRCHQRFFFPGFGSEPCYCKDDRQSCPPFADEHCRTHARQKNDGVKYDLNKKTVAREFAAQRQRWRRQPSLRFGNDRMIRESTEARDVPGREWRSMARKTGVGGPGGLWPGLLNRLSIL
jgi:hypothetical protein